MRKNLFFLLMIICSTITAQIDRTFIPETGKTYAITHQQQGQTSTFGRYLSENPSTQRFIYEEGTSEYTRWTVEYTEEGYTFKNVKTGHYFTYVGEVEYEGSMQWGNSIDLSASGVEADKCYFELLQAVNPFSIGNDSFTFTSQGYGIIATVGQRALNSFALAAGDRWIGSWNYEGGDNENWLILDEEQQADFEKAIKATAFPFTPQEETYYIKISATPYLHDYLAENAQGELIFVSDRTSEEVQWNIACTDEKGYTLQNRKSGHYFTYAGSGADGTITLSSSDPDESKCYFNFRKPDQTFQLTSSIHTFEKQGYTILIPGEIHTNGNFVAIDLNVRTGELALWEMTNQENQRWLFLTESEVENYEKARYPFQPEEQQTYYLMNKRAADYEPHFIYQSSETNENGSLIKGEVVTPDEAKDLEGAIWEITLEKENGGYFIKNTSSGKYFKYISGNTENGIVTAGKEADLSPFRYLLKESSATYAYSYINETAERKISFPVYSIEAMLYQQEFDNYGSNGATGTWTSGEQFTHSFILLSASQLDEFIQLQANEATGINIRSEEALTSINTSDIQPANEIVLTGTWALDDLNYFLANEATQSMTFLDLTQIKLPVGDLATLKNPNALIAVKAGVNQEITLWKNLIINNESTRITLQDGKDHPFYAPETISVTEKIAYERLCYTDGEWETIWTPFDVTSIRNQEGAEVSYDLKELVSSTAGIVNFNDVANKEIKGNTPYMIRFAEVEEAEQQTYTLYGVGTLYATGDLQPATGTKPEFAYSFNGTYQTIEGEDLYMVTLDEERNTVFGLGEAGSYLEPFRAFIKIVGEDIPEVIKYLTIGNDNGTTDLISPSNNGMSIWSKNGEICVYTNQTQMLDVWSVDGRLVRRMQVVEGYNSMIGLAKGIYIVNNSKVVIK